MSIDHRVDILAGSSWKRSLSSGAQQQWFFAITLTLSALVLNAMICGALSQVTSRFQAQVHRFTTAMIKMVKMSNGIQDTRP